MNFIAVNNDQNKNKIEKFGPEDISDGCHYACSLINWINTLLLLVIVVILYQYLGN